MLYSRLLKGLGTEISVVDLGAGVNGLSYKFFPKDLKVSYVGLEAVGQLVDLMNYYFEKNKINGALALRGSLFNLDKVEEIIKRAKKPRVIFLFKVLDSLESVERDYSKKLLKRVAPLAERVAVSFATKSLSKKKKFFVNRKWLKEFIHEDFFVQEEFEMMEEKYLVFSKKGL